VNVVAFGVAGDSGEMGCGRLVVSNGASIVVDSVVVVLVNVGVGVAVAGTKENLPVMICPTSVPEKSNISLSPRI
jgi:hypothetical protein